MRAVVVRAHGGPEALHLETLPVPEPGPCQVRVRVEAVALNFLDVWVRRGVPGHSFPLPIIPGCDVAGTVDALGPGSEGVRLGDAVLLNPGISCGRCAACREGNEPLCRSYHILGETRDGGCAEFVVVPAVFVVFERLRKHQPAPVEAGARDYPPVPPATASERR